MTKNKKIESNGTEGKVTLNGTDISTMLMSTDIHLCACEAPRITFECINPATTLYEVKHNVGKYDELITAAIAILQAELLKHSDIYNGFLACINSAIKEKFESAELCHSDIFIDTEDWAESVLERIIGEE